MAMMTEWQERPWGAWRIVSMDPEVTKIIRVDPGCMLSLQKHERRSELWIPYSDGLISYRASQFGELVTSLEKGKSHQIGLNEWHRLINPTAYPKYLIEIITGEYDENDIVRAHDAYGRA